MLPFDVLPHLIGRIRTSRIDASPFPHFCGKRAFPDAFFASMTEALPDRGLYEPRDDHGRPAPKDEATQAVLRLAPESLAHLDERRAEFWSQVGALLESEAVARALVDLTMPYIKRRLLGRAQVSFRATTYLCHFKPGYALGPHTDSPHKVATLIFYLGPSDAARDLGTAIYRPRDRAFSCAGGPHYDFANFDRVMSAPFIPNHMFGFVKSETSFHGVEPLRAGLTRDTLAYTLALA